MTSVKTRRSSGGKLSEYIGSGKDFLPSELPTLRALLRKGIQLQNEKLVSSNFYPELAQVIAKASEPQWIKANVVFIPPKVGNLKSNQRSLEKESWRAQDIACGREQCLELSSTPSLCFSDLTSDCPLLEVWTQHWFSSTGLLKAWQCPGIAQKGGKSLSWLASNSEAGYPSLSVPIGIRVFQKIQNMQYVAIQRMQVVAHYCKQYATKIWVFLPLSNFSHRF